MRTPRPPVMLLSAILMLLTVAGLAAPATPRSSVGGGPDYDRDVRPILADHCFTCHGFDANKRQAGLRLDTAEGALAALATGHRAIVPGSPERSELIRRVAAGTMPPGGKEKSLKPAQISTLRRWVAAGAHYARHWAFVPPRRPTLPTVRDVGWPRNPIDRFVLARLEREGLKPSPEADGPTLIRRVSLDLTGLPPTPEEVDAFLADRTPGAYERLVDRLLASPRFGERMAWDWLDAARYADTNGYQGDRTRTMWPWRDWVVRAFNADLPYDRFTVEQLAGDLLPEPTLDQRIATGFNRNHMLNGEGGRIPEESRIDYVVDRVDTTSTVWLGLSMGCARCHDHKYDPFTQRDYYRLFAYFNNVPESGAVDRGGMANPVLLLPTPEQSSKIAGLMLRIGSLEAEIGKAPQDRRPELQTRLDQARKELRSTEDGITALMVMQELAAPRETRVLVRGAYDRPAERVAAGTPASLPTNSEAGPTNRLGLARWMVDPANPLTARVAVNRNWQMLFGHGIVKTQEDFGVQGERPSHPELLDWLAVTFAAPVAGAEPGLGWSVKGLLRLILTSATYRQVSRTTPAMLERDPENRLLGRAPRFRLSSAAIRDQALLASGLLVERLGGPPVKTYQPPGVWEDATFGQIRFEQDRGEALYRRSLYTFWRRIVAPTGFFDIASRQACTVRQARTNTPLHALLLLNDVTYAEAARVMAERVLRRFPDSPTQRSQDAQIEYAFRLAVGRRPTAGERPVLRSALERMRKAFATDPKRAEELTSAGEAPRASGLDPAGHAAMTALCSLILNLDETITRS